MLFFLPTVVTAQDAGAADEGWDEILESVLSMKDEEVDRENVYNALSQLHDNPIDLNSADRSELNNLFFLTFSQVDSLLSYRSLHGRFLSVRELYYVDGLDENTARMLIPFVTVRISDAGSKNQKRNILRDGKKSFLTKIYRNLEVPVGYHNAYAKGPEYLGSPLRVLNRFKIISTDRFAAGFTMEKDPGEPLVWSPARDYFGFDQYSYYVSLLNRGKLKNLTLGNYKLQFGQGLVLGNGFFLGKSTETIASIDNKSFRIRAYGGAGESGYFHGPVVNYRFGCVDITAFFSYQRIDTRTDTLSSGEVLIRSINITGLHRTPHEILFRKNNTELSSGGHIGYVNKQKNLEIGFSAVYTAFRCPVEEDPDYYNQFDFSGRKLVTQGVDYRYFHRKFSVFGEVASSEFKNWGIVNGLIVNLSKNVETAISVRYYNPSFHTLFGNPLREASSPGNESGIYWGLKIIPVKKVKVNLYYDTFHFPWLKYKLREPSSGNEIFSRIIVDPWRNFTLSLLYRQKIMDTSDPAASGGIVNAVPGLKRQTRLQADYQLTKTLQSKTRIQYSDYKILKSNTSGFAAFQELGWHLNKLSWFAGATWFHTEDFLNRQYLYEQGALYDFNIPSYHGDGIRLYTLITWKASRHFKCWIKTGRIFYRGISSTGTGLDEISGNRKTDMLLQAEYNF